MTRDEYIDHLAGLLDISRPRVKRALESLEAKGLIESYPPNTQSMQMEDTGK